MTDHYYKFTTISMRAPIASGFQYPEVGVWFEPIDGPLMMCKWGYHALPKDELLPWIDSRLFRVEYRGEAIIEDRKIVAREMRLVEEITTWDEKTKRLFAVWCARKALEIAIPIKEEIEPVVLDLLDALEKYANDPKIYGNMKIIEKRAFFTITRKKVLQETTTGQVYSAVYSATNGIAHKAAYEAGHWATRAIGSYWYTKAGGDTRVYSSSTVLFEAQARKLLNNHLLEVLGI